MQPDASNSSSPLSSMWGMTEVIFWSLTPTSAISFRPLAGSITLPLRIIRDLKIRRRRMSATAVMTEGDWEDVAVARREN